MTDPTPEVIRSLIEKVEAGSGPDPDLGKEILLACGGRRTCVGHFYGPIYQWAAPWGASFDEDDFRRHNPLASIDAAVALTEKLLPGWARNVGIWPRARHRPGSGEYSTAEANAELIECGPNGWHDGGIHNTVRAKGSSEPRALLSATLRAKLAMMEDG